MKHLLLSLFIFSTLFAAQQEEITYIAIDENYVRELQKKAWDLPLVQTDLVIAQHRSIILERQRNALLTIKVINPLIIAGISSAVTASAIFGVQFLLKRK